MVVAAEKPEAAVAGDKICAVPGTPGRGIGDPNPGFAV
jgi:hypothetical protein